MLVRSEARPLPKPLTSRSSSKGSDPAPAASTATKDAPAARNASKDAAPAASNASNSALAASSASNAAPADSIASKAAPAAKEPDEEPWSERDVALAKAAARQNRDPVMLLALKVSQSLLVQ